MSAYTDWAEGDLSPWEKVNHGFDSVGQGLTFAERPDGHSGLNVGIGGGPYTEAITISDQQVACADNDDNYIVANRSTGAVTDAITTTNWDDTTTYGRIGIATFASGVLTYRDFRYTEGGIFRSAGTTAAALQGSGLDVDAAGFRGIPQNSQGGNYTTVAADAGKHLYHPSGAGAGDTFTIDSNANVAYEVGTAITFVNMDSNAVSIAITSDTMYLAGTGTTGTRTLAQYGVATAIKLTSTTWVISGTGLT